MATNTIITTSNTKTTVNAVDNADPLEVLVTTVDPEVLVSVLVSVRVSECDSEWDSEWGALSSAWDDDIVCSHLESMIQKMCCV